MKKIAIFASGYGSNAEAIVKYFDGREDIKVEIVLSNRSNAAIHEKMGKLGIPSVTFQKEQWNESTTIVELLKEKSIDLIVLAERVHELEYYHYPRVIESLLLQS